MHRILSILPRFRKRRPEAPPPPTECESFSHRHSLDISSVALEESEVGRNSTILNNSDGTQTHDSEDLQSRPACCCTSRTPDTKAVERAERSPVSCGTKTESQTQRSCCTKRESNEEENLTRNRCKCVSSNGLYLRHEILKFY